MKKEKWSNGNNNLDMISKGTKIATESKVDKKGREREYEKR